MKMLRTVTLLYFIVCFTQKEIMRLLVSILLEKFFTIVHKLKSDLLDIAHQA